MKGVYPRGFHVELLSGIIHANRMNFSWAESFDARVSNGFVLEAI